MHMRVGIEWVCTLAAPACIGSHPPHSPANTSSPLPHSPLVSCPNPDLQACLVVALCLANKPLVSVFTRSAEVIQMTQGVIPVVAVTVVADGTNALMSGTLRACGRQSWGAALNLIGYWCMGCPIAILCGFYLKMDVLVRGG